MALFGSSAPAASSPEQQEIKAAVIKQLQTQAAITNARQLIGKVNEHCFDNCITSPGSTMSPNDSTCLSQCMEKYISLWNVASKTYLSRASADANTIAANSLATGAGLDASAV
ncbi:Tim10/DDP family zinc finger-domain-containing protein [Aspergillus unguis]